MDRGEVWWAELPDPVASDPLFLDHGGGFF